MDDFYRTCAIPDERAQRRFWSFVEKPVAGDGCWLWTRSKMGNGYGVFCLGKKRVPAHRIAYLITKGRIDAGLELDHLCRTRFCVNPSHLEPVTRAENLRRSELTGPGRNHAKTHCVRGHDLVNAYVFTDKKGVKHRWCRVCQNLWREGWCSKCGNYQTDVRRHQRTCKAFA